MLTRLLVLILALALPSFAAAAPPRGAVATGYYPNLIREWNPRIGEVGIRSRLDLYWSSLFGTGPERRVFAIGSEIHRLDLGDAGK